ncbi:MAG: RNase J family beta-CASP ribonuclease [Candidatus Methanoperedens sp.]|nr:RNase J family beta-CASP ribonuclease [Candidatus Methanoperedens sp.]MCZ7396638.1 RNase J family beta-CASP ribonuclease [Candidatus Methanoperedens sp.]
MTEIGIIAVGGYNEMGRNMTGIRIDNDIIVLDMGLQLDRVQIHEDVEIDKMHSMDLIKIGAIPDDTVMKEVSGSVKAIVCTHGHLDHIGAIPKLAHRYKAPIIATPYTAELVRHEISEEKKFKVTNEVIPLRLGGTYNLTPDIQIEFIRIQHSIVDSAFAAIHTPGGVVLYASDFKLDRTPTLGEPPDFQRLRKLGKEGVRAMITESTNSGLSGKTPSEQIAKDLVRDVLLGTEETDSGVLITTFSSHVARIKAIIEAAEEMNRIPVLLGRSMERYLSIAEKMNYIKFPENLEIHGNRNAVEKALRRISQDGKKKYLLITTGHQGEPDSILTRIANLETQFKIEPGDKVIFSANTIPSPMTMANRHALEIKLKMQGARIYENVHVSGHASREDHWELLRMISPEQVIPSHGNMTMHASYVEMAEDAGYVFGDTVHIMRNGEEMVL